MKPEVILRIRHLLLVGLAAYTPLVQETPPVRDTHVSDERTSSSPPGRRPGPLAYLCSSHSSTQELTDAHTLLQI